MNVAPGSDDIAVRMMRFALAYPDEWDVVMGSAPATVAQTFAVRIPLLEAGFTELPELMAMRVHRMLEDEMKSE